MDPHPPLRAEIKETQRSGGATRDLLLKTQLVPEMYCWARNTYFASFEDEYLPEVPERGKSMVSYYQWVPFFLVVVAFMFYSPCLLWRILYDKSGIRLNDIMNFANDKSNVQPASRRANINGLAMHLSSVFKHRFRFGSSHPYHHKLFKFLNLRFYEAYLTFLYIGIKLLFLINVLVQVILISPSSTINKMILLSRFLQTNSQGFYGYGILWDLVTGHGWTESPNFPVVTYCDMEIRILGNIQRHTVQCVLVINIFTEKIFLLLWLWYTLLAIISFGSIMSWIFSSLPFEQRRRYGLLLVHMYPCMTKGMIKEMRNHITIKQFLLIIHLVKLQSICSFLFPRITQNPPFTVSISRFIARRLELADVTFKQRDFTLELDEFVRDYVKMDGVFVLRMITIHSGVLMCTEVVDTMWDQFLAEQGEDFRPQSDQRALERTP
ncbi:unnamed protein product [Strongylus vulgaris]|uniref:Innexin n=1 Tax=Strongylus vulgaris TaxID=40348 RepID=A0A3P7IZG5_STRVU|nr:unnamed protein product [Strongylus vulgaris]